MGHILLVDDDSAFTDLLAIILGNDGYKTVTAHCAEDALKSVAEEAPDLVISDVEMPGMSGFELVKTLQESPIYRKIPIMLMSARRVSSADRVGGLSLGSDDYLLKPIISQELLARVKAVLRRTEIGLDANPLSRLPGNTTIHQVFERKIQTREPFAALYADLNHFKAYNDRYGFLKGDDVIRFTSQVLVSVTQAISAGKDFVGHIGGDDFIVVTVPERAEPLAESIIQEFTRGVPAFYNEEDQRRGQLEVMDRQGKPMTVPLMGIAIGIVTNAKRPIEQVGEISQIGAELKSYAKKLGGSRYALDRRGP